MIYVFFQFGILILLALRVEIVAIDIYGIAVFVFAAFVGLWAIYTMGSGNVRIRPELMDGAILKVHGPYKYIRHPMYTSVLFIALSMAISPLSMISILLFAGMWVTLYLKLTYEEKQLINRFPEYAEYKKQTHFIIPFIL